MVPWSILLALGCPLVTDAQLDVLRDQDGDGFAGADRGGRDCDDTNPEVNPAAAEICNDIDDDCDALLDAEDPDLLDALVGYDDLDQDGFGDPETARAMCTLEEGAVARAEDCDDTDPTQFPEALWFRDRDGDGFGDPAEVIDACEASPGWVPLGTDCDDLDFGTHPDAVEVPRDGIDNDCDGGTDLEDFDGDGLADFPDDAPCAGVAAAEWRVPGDFDGIAEALRDDRIQDCDLIRVDTGSYARFALDRPLRIVAEPGALVEVVAAGPDHYGIDVDLPLGELAVLDRLVVRDFPVGLRHGNGRLLASVEITDGILGVEVVPDFLQATGLELVSSGLRRLDQALYQYEGTLDLEAVEIESVLSALHVVQIEGVLLVPELRVRGLTIRDSAATEGALISTLALDAVVDIDGLVVEQCVGAVIQSGSSTWSLKNVEIRGAVSTQAHFVSLGSLGGTGEVDGLLVEDSWWVPSDAVLDVAAEGMVQYSGFAATTLRHLHFRDNVIWGDRAHIAVNSTVAISHVSVVGDYGAALGAYLADVTVDHATFVGPDRAVDASLASVTLRDSIVAGTNTVFDDLGFATLDLENTALLDNCALGDADGAGVVHGDPGMVRYEPNLGARVLDVRLVPGSPFADQVPGCSEPDGTDCDLGAYGGAGFDRDPRTYQDADGDGLYDSWECLISDDPACRCFDDARFVCAENFVGIEPGDDFDLDGATEEEEFAMGTLPYAPDTDADGLLDGVDPAPLTAEGDPGRCAD